MIVRCDANLQRFAGGAFFLICALLAICFTCFPHDAFAQDEVPATTIVGIKLMKSERGKVADHATIQPPADCANCVVLHGPFYEGQNARELFFYLRVPISLKSIPRIHVNTGGAAIRAVIVEKNSIPYSQRDGAVEFTLPVDARERSSTLELQTNLEWPGLTIRIEHAFEDRRAGTYAEGQWPATERQAALNLEFSLREAIRTLGLDKKVYSEGLGTIHLMGFDTNYPLGHEDSPPHIHLILRWPHFAGSQAPHFYLTGDGLIRGTTVTIDGIPSVGKISIPDGTPFPAVDYLGHEVFKTTVNSDGSLSIAQVANKKATCRLLPAESAQKNGFAAGVIVRCDGTAEVRVRTEDNTDRGELQVWMNSATPEIYRYNPDTAALISSSPALPKFARESSK